MADGGAFVEALYAYSYQAADGRQIAFTEGETFTLIKKSNEDWWHVKRDGEKPMYVPATYMKVLDNLDETHDKCPLSQTQVDSRSVSSLGSEDCFIEYDGTYSDQLSPSRLEENGINDRRQSAESNEQRDTSSSELQPVDGANVKCLTKALESSSIKLRGSVSSKVDLLERPKSQSLPHGWALATDEETGRPYYFNSKTNETSWKPPRTKSVPSPRSSPIASPRSSRTSMEKVTPPLGWRLSRSVSTDEMVYVNDCNDEKWQSSTDEYGRVYFYQVNGTLTAWELPEVAPVTRQSFEALDVTFRQKSPNLKLRGSKSQTLLMRGPQRFSYNRSSRPVDLSPLDLPPFPLMHNRTESNLSADSLSSDDSPLPAPPVIAPTCAIGSVERQGTLNRKKIIESGGKKIKRPSWTQTFVMLFSTNLVFFKDQKAALAKPGLPHGKPESSCDLRGANLGWIANSGITKKKNSFQVSTVSGAVFLLQSDSNALSMEWFNAIASVIYRLNEEEPSFAGTVQGTAGSQDTFLAATLAKGYESDDTLDDNAHSPSISSALTAGTLLRSFSKRRSGSDDRSNMKDRLKKLISRRPPIEELERKGIIQERRVFDCHLTSLCDREGSTVPTFVTKIIEAIEKKGLDFDGLYRVSGNLSMIQKLRIMVDQEEKVKMGEAPFDDIHVLAGSLKLFFRELPEPLFPFDLFNGFVDAIKQSTRNTKLNHMKKQIQKMPSAHKDTLKFLLKHLTKVMALSDTNRMHAQNLAIVFGPTLMWPKFDLGNIAINTVHQNQIVEFLLLEYDNVFK